MELEPLVESVLRMETVPFVVARPEARLAVER